ncbi:TetR/AcrR family transcriptional regulator [Kribbella sp. NPDC056861]|uniref:TetR/AcrR family transcriptional regulator n=1 Tax=Kribbella sp. NPDC056861 TaxID=3154857 RepID=UPI003423D16C
MATESDPRFHRSSEAILAAARELLIEQGPAAVTHAQVAKRAGIGRATVYRHWPRVDQLLAEAMATVPMPLFDAPTAPIRDWLHAELTALARLLELHDVRAVATTLAQGALWDPAMDSRRGQFAGVLSERLADALDSAAAAGEVELRTTAQSAAALAIGPIYYRSTIEREPVDSDFIDAAIDSLGVWSAPSR